MKTKTTPRFDRAVTKLYTAFHNGELDAMDCKHCAVGNICDNRNDWRYTGFYVGAPKEDAILFNLNPDKVVSESGYSVVELANIESIFMFGKIPNQERKWYKDLGLSGWSAKDINYDNKENIFIALTRVIEYLCELDNIPNVMDYSKLFEYEGDKAVNQLILS